MYLEDVTQKQDEFMLGPELVWGAMQRFPNRVALRDQHRTMRYAALQVQVIDLARLLRRSGLEPGDLVGLCLPRSIERIAVMLAAWRLGAAVVMLDPDWPTLRLAQIQEEAGCRLIIVPDGASVDGMDSARVFRCGANWSAQDGAPADSGAPEAEARLTPDTLAYLIYTSGSTGRPKGVEITHGNLAALIAWHVAAFAVSPDDRATHLAGVAFDAAIWEVWPYLVAGASVHLAPELARTSPELLQTWLVEAGATIAFAPTLLAESMILLPWPRTELRVLLTGGDRLRRRPPADLPFTLVNNYGPSECTVVACSGVVPPGPGGDAPPSIGRPIASTYVRILDAAGRPVADGEAGEIHIGGASVGRGYHARVEETADRFITDPLGPDTQARLYRSGDLGSWRADGAIDFHGRADDQLKIRGQRVEPEEVAATLMQHPEVRAAAVAGVASPEGVALAAYIVVATDAAPTAEALRAFIVARLPEFMVPSRFVGLKELPVTAHGKLDRAALPALATADLLPMSAGAGGENPTELRLIAILREVLGRREVGIDDNFFLLGGHSLLGTQVVLRASDAFGVELTLAHLFNAPSVRELAVAVEALILEAVAAMGDEELLSANG